MASDYLLEIEGVKGESRDEKHKGAIDIESFSWGVTNSGSVRGGGGGGSGKATFQDFSFSKREDSTSPTLMLRCAMGEHFKKAVLTVRKSGEDQVEYLVITLEDVMVTSYQQNGSSPDVPEDNFSLNFGKITYAHSSQDPAGSTGNAVKVSWDLAKGKGA